MIQKLIDKTKEYCEKYGAHHTIIDIERDVLKINNPLLSYCFARDIEGADIKAHGQVVINSKDACLNYCFARDIEGADIKAHSEIIISSKNPEYNYYFASEVKGIDIKAHRQAVIESKNSYFNFCFAMHIPSSSEDIKNHLEVINKPEWKEILISYNRTKENDLEEIKQIISYEISKNSDNNVGNVLVKKSKKDNKSQQ